MKTKCYMLFVSFSMIGAAFGSTNIGISDELYESLRRTAHKPSYENLRFDETNVWDVKEVSQETHKPDYTRKVVKIDHKGETLTIETEKKTRRKKTDESSSSSSKK